MSADFERQRALLAWFAAAQRSMPWRHPEPGPHPDPYAVLVSELMLQQTRVDAVIEPFERWMRRFPDFASLAAAPVDAAVEAWAGLGYYRRARALHAAASRVADEHSGVLPHDADALAALPGVGPYTVGALRSIAFDLPAALVDGNVARVLARWHAREGDEATLRKRAWRDAEAELAADDAPARGAPSQWSQALMELGATVCKPGEPDCAGCPVRAGCRAAALGVAASIPPPRKRAPVRDVFAAALVIVTQRDGRPHVWLRKQPEHGRWAGLWQPPLFEAESVEAALASAQAFAADAGLRVVTRGEVEHVLTHRRYRVSVLAATVEQSPRAVDAEPTRWSPLAEIRGRGDGVSRLGVRVVDAAREPAQPDLFRVATSSSSSS